MLTMKIVHTSLEESNEFIREIGSFATKVYGDNFMFIAYDGDEFSTQAVYGGKRENCQNPPKDAFQSRIFVMNDKGSTVANYRYYTDCEEMKEPKP